MPAESTKRKALETLDTMREIVKRGRLKHDGYISDDIADKKLHQTGAICDGRNYCMIGTLWIAGGVKPHFGSAYVDLPGVHEFERDDFVAHRPALKLAYEALNEAAETRIKRIEDSPEGYPLRHFSSAAESYFEDYMGEWGNDDEKEVERKVRRATYSLLDSAKKIVEAA